MKCPNCGTEFEGNICPSCNTQMPVVPETATESNEPIKEEISPSEPIGSVEESEQIIVEGESTEPSSQDFQPDLNPPKKIFERKAFKITRIILECACVLFLLCTLYALGDTVKKANKNVEEHNEFVKQYDLLEKNYSSLADEYDNYKEKMKPYEEMEAAEAEAKKIAAEKEVEEQKAAEQKAAEEAAAAKAAEEAKGYETGISYEQLARTPDDFKGKKVKFYGKVIQVMEDSGATSTQIRLAVDDNYDTVLYGEYSSSIVSSRVLENDYITIYGTSVGTISYQSTMGGNITIPGIYIEKIDQ